MWIETGLLRHFRNYETLRLDLASHKNLFIGDNGAGKTNILELIDYLSHGRSRRTRHDRELVQWGENAASIKLVAQSHAHEGSLTVEAQLVLTAENSLKTQFKLNGNLVRNRSEIVGKIPTVTFFLSDLRMLRGAPEDRRNALDSSLLQYDPLHFKRLGAYNRVRQQKSRLLKQSFRPLDTELLDSLDQQLVMTGSDLMHARIHYLQLMRDRVGVRYHELSQGRETLTLSYQSSCTQPVSFASRECLEQELYQAIQASRSEERRLGQVLVGPHRDDIRFFLDERDASLFGSQGQQRSIVLAMKLAEIEVLKDRLRNETPILLLDDVMAELDPKRQSQLLAHLDGGMQVLLTTTHLGSDLEWFLQEGGSTRLFSISQGRVTQEPAALVEGMYAQALSNP